MTEDNLERSPASGGIIAKQACPKAFRETKKFAAANFGERRRLPLPCPHISNASPTEPATMWRPRARPTSGGRTPLTGSILTAGALVRASRGSRPPRRQSDSTLQLRLGRVDGRWPAELRLHDRAPPLRPDLDLRPARDAARSQGPPIAIVHAGIRNGHAAPPRQREADLPETSSRYSRRSISERCAICAIARCR